LSRTLLQGAAARYIAVDFAVPNPDAALHDIAVDSQGVAWVNQLNVTAWENSIRRPMNIPRFLRPPATQKSAFSITWVRPREASGTRSG